MNKHKINSLAFVFLLLITGTNCKKSESPPEPEYIQFPAWALKYVKLTEGKYLVYKDSANGDLDSVVVTNSKVTKKYHLSYNYSLLGPSYYYDDFSLVLTEWQGGNQETWFKGNANAVYGITDLGLMETYDSTQSSFAFYYPVTSPSDEIPSMIIEGKNYDSVVKKVYERGSPNDPRYAKRTFYWAKIVGIIKREIVGAGGTIKTHTLLRHN